MRVAHARPPNYDAIAAALGTPPDSAVFAYGDVVYSPSGHDLPPDLEVHEAVHFEQQAACGGPENWWTLYLTDPAFRLAQELEAYRKQIASHDSRARRRECMRRVAKDLASPMYGGLVSKAEALRLLRRAD